MIRSILEQAGHTVGLIGTIETVVGKSSSVSERTTPESLDLQRVLAKMVEEKCTYAVMEVSSHALELKRTAGMHFHSGVFTNLTQDHLDFHQTAVEYFQSKARLFKQLTGFGVINLDDPHGGPWQLNAPIVGYGVEQMAQVRAKDIAESAQYTLSAAPGDTSLELRLTGTFNVYNSLPQPPSAGEGIDLETVRRGLAYSGCPVD